MAKAKKILDRINAVGSTKQITQAMKMVAVAKLSKLKSRAARELPYVNSYLELFEEITSLEKEALLLPAFEVRPVKSALIICLTTDRGLCGAFNQYVLQNVLARYQAYKSSGVKVDVLPVGQKGMEFLQRRDIFCVTDYVSVERSMEGINRVADFGYDSFLGGKYDCVELVYQPSRVAAKEKVASVSLLPVVSKALPEGEQGGEYEYEPHVRHVVSEMVRHVVRGEVYKAWLISSIAEESVRMLVTSQATDNAEKLIKGLRLTYNRVRQSAITRSLSEMVAGADAMC